MVVSRKNSSSMIHHSAFKSHYTKSNTHHCTLTTQYHYYPPKTSTNQQLYYPSPYIDHFLPTISLTLTRKTMDKVMTRDTNIFVQAPVMKWFGFHCRISEIMILQKLKNFKIRYLDNRVFFFNFYVNIVNFLRIVV